MRRARRRREMAARAEEAKAKKERREAEQARKKRLKLEEKAERAKRNEEKKRQAKIRHDQRSAEVAQRLQAAKARREQKEHDARRRHHERAQQALLHAQAQPRGLQRPMIVPSAEDPLKLKIFLPDLKVRFHATNAVRIRLRGVGMQTIRRSRRAAKCVHVRLRGTQTLSKKY